MKQNTANEIAWAVVCTVLNGSQDKIEEILDIRGIVGEDRQEVEYAIDLILNDGIIKSGAHY